MNNHVYQTVKEIIPTNIQYGSILNINTNGVSTHTHSFHKYPAKFIPHIPKWAISKYLNENNKTILDPFCGSGTTLIEGLLANHNVIGIDIDPLSVMISKVKTTIIDIDLLDKISIWFKKEINSGNVGLFNPECATIKHWFTEDVINNLSLLRTLINNITIEFGNKQSVKKIQSLFLICFSSIIRRASNADNESQKTYVSHTKVKKPEEVYSLFEKQLELYKTRISSFSKIVNPKLRNDVFCSSSSQSLQKLLNKKIDLVVTSPPYIKAIDYIYNQMVEFFWIGDLFDLQTQTKQNETKSKYIGNKHLKKAEYINYDPNINNLDINQLDLKLQKIFFEDKKNGHKHAYITHKYFKEMENHFSEISKYLRKNIHYIMVVGNSSVSNTIFETDNYLIEIAQRNGFKLINKWGYKIKNRYMRFDRKGRGGLIEIDWVLDFVKI